MHKFSIKQLLILLLLISGQAAAQSSGGDFEIVRETIDNGGGRSSDDTFVVTGTIGQHDAFNEAATGDVFVVTGGFWGSGRLIFVIFEDGFESIDPDDSPTDVSTGEDR